MTKKEKDKKMNDAILKAGYILADAWNECGLSDTGLIFAPVFSHPHVYALKFYRHPEKKITAEYLAEAERRRELRKQAKKQGSSRDQTM